MLPETYLKKLLLALFLLLSVDTFAQEMLGLRNSNFAGIHGIGLNPASMVDSRLKWDVNFFSGGVSFENDYLFIPKSKLDFLGLGNIVRQVEKKTYLDEAMTQSKKDHVPGPDQYSVLQSMGSKLAGGSFSNSKFSK